MKHEFFFVKNNQNSFNILLKTNNKRGIKLGRTKAALIHLLISIFIFSLFLSLVFFIWYAYPFYITQGVTNLVYLMAGIDIVLGPLLTFIIYKAGKKGLKFDLSVIGIVQVAALLYGGYIIYSQRPAWVVFAVDRFEVVSLVEVNSSELNNQNLTVGVLDKPKIVYAKKPVGELASKILDSSLAGGKDIAQTASLYEEFNLNKDKVFKAAKKIETHPILKNETHIKESKWLPVQGKHKDIIAILDDESKTIVQYKIIHPWQ